MLTNALHVPLTNHNLIAPFIMRYGGDTINDVMKIIYEDPIVNDHVISFDQSNLLIPLQLNGVFS